jgi:uncharacterized membrane protein
MTDQTPTPSEAVTIVAAQVADEQGVLAEGAIAAQGDHALIVARFANADAAIAVYYQLLVAEAESPLHIDGVLVAKGGDDGKIHIQAMTEHSTKTGLKWGIVGGAVAAIFLPATIIGGAVAMGIAGAAAGKARNLYHRIEVEKELADVITPGTSGILCLVSSEEADAVRLKMPDAEEVKTVPVDEETASAIKEVAVAADAATSVADAPAAPAEAPAES